MRLSVASLRRVVKGDLAIQFVPQQLTSYSGLELLRRYGQRLRLAARLRAAFAGLRSDYGNARVGLMLLALFFVGGWLSRLETSSAPVLLWLHAGLNRPGPEEQRRYGDVRVHQGRRLRRDRESPHW